MTSSIRVLLVTPSTCRARLLSRWLAPAGYEVSVATSYSAGRAGLQQQPHVVITDLKLGDFNGLQLAIRAGAMDVPAIVLGVDDPVLRREAQQAGAIWFASTAPDRVLLLAAVDAAASLVQEVDLAAGMSLEAFAALDASPSHAHSRRPVLH